MSKAKSPKADATTSEVLAKAAVKKSNKPTTANKVAEKVANKIVAKKVVAEIVDPDEDQQSDHLRDEYADENSIEPIDDPREQSLLSDDEPVLLESKSSSTAITSADPVTLYMAELRKYPLLSREQELELAKKYYDTKDPQAAQILVTSNLRFVVKVAAEYSKFGARLIDLIQEGNMGLMHAVKDFNPYKGVKLITYAVWWIRGYIQEYLMKQFSMVKIGTTQNQKKLFYQLQREKENLEKLAEGKNLKLMSERLGIPEDEIQIMAQRLSGKDVSLNQTLDSSSSTQLLDMQRSTNAESPDEQLAKHEELDQLHQAIEVLKPKLSEREKILLDERLLNDEPLTLQEIGQKYGITREAVRQAEERLMKKIREEILRGQSR